ncbi:MAG: selenocysteine synthase [Gemmatimonadetes bacterium]|nr:selenocysteine synthase [Gemmatimonadota bacterium]
MTDSRRALPSIGLLLESAGVRALLETMPRDLVVSAVRDVVERARDNVAAAPMTTGAWSDAVATQVTQVTQVRRSSLRRVINATGIVLHTNLGRAPLSRAALDAVLRVGAGYTTLEYDLARGTRGSRYTHCASLLRELTGAEDALVVNNCAAALVLALNTLALGRDAVLSRGELVEIGGSFRVHEIMERSGARLREVGATNRTHLADYASAIDNGTGALLKVHRSNFALEGFVCDVDVRDLVPLARRHDLPIVHDLGSGLLISLASIGLDGEPTAREALNAGASVVVMSGDKLLGGPQAGIILGGIEYLSAMRSNPLARSYRVDKLTLAALEATLAVYREPDRALREIPALALLGASASELHSRATRTRNALNAAGIDATVIASTSSVGAGAFPQTELPSTAVALPGNADQWTSKLRSGDPAVVGRVRDGHALLDMRAVPDDEIDLLIERVIAAHD